MGVRAEFLEATLATGRPIRPATADLVFDAGAWLTGQPAELWAADDLLALAWYGVLAWCRLNGDPVPPDAAATVGRLADHLDPGGETGLRAAVGEVIDPVSRTSRRRTA